MENDCIPVFRDFSNTFYAPYNISARPQAELRYLAPALSCENFAYREATSRLPIPNPPCDPDGLLHCDSPTGNLPSNTPTPVRDSLQENPDDFAWLLNNKQRRQCRQFQQLSACVRTIRDDLGIKNKSDINFSIGMKQIIAWYNKGVGPKQSEIDPHREDLWDAIATILVKSTSNSVYYNNKKMKRSLDSHKASTPVENPLSDSAKASSTAGIDVLSTKEIGVNTVATGFHKDGSLTLEKEDMVILLGDLDQHVAAVAIVVENLIVIGNNRVDFDHVKVKILTSGLSSHKRGDFVQVPVASLAVIKTSPRTLADELIDNSGCQRKDDCHLNVGDFVLLDLDKQYAQWWPLVAKLKELHSNKKMKIQWFWVNGQPASIMDGDFDPWLDSSGKVMEEVVPTQSHYFCQFELDGGKLPEAAKAACRERIAMSSPELESDDNF